MFHSNFSLHLFLVTLSKCDTKLNFHYFRDIKFSLVCSKISVRMFRQLICLLSCLLLTSCKVECQDALQTEQPIEPRNQALAEPVGPSNQAPMEPSNQAPVEPSNPAPMEQSKQETMESSNQALVESSNQVPMEQSNQAPMEPIQQVQQVQPVQGKILYRNYVFE